MANPGHEPMSHDAVPTITTSAPVTDMQEQAPDAVPASTTAPGPPAAEAPAQPPASHTSPGPPLKSLPQTSSTHTIENEKEGYSTTPTTLGPTSRADKRLSKLSTNSLAEDPADKLVPQLQKQKEGSLSSSEDEKAPKKKKGLGDIFKKKSKEEKKEEKSEDLKPIGITKLFRFATPFELFLNFIGLILAIASGATQPLMTLIFGRLTTSFNNFGRVVRQIQSEGMTPENALALETAKKVLKKDAGNNALYLMAIGLGLVSGHTLTLTDLSLSRRTSTCSSGTGHVSARTSVSVSYTSTLSCAKR